MAKDMNISKGSMVLIGLGLIAATAFLTALYMAKPQEEPESNAAGGGIRQAFRRMWRRSKPKFGGGDDVPLFSPEVAMPDKKDMDTAPTSQTT